MRRYIEVTATFSADEQFLFANLVFAAKVVTCYIDRVEKNTRRCNERCKFPIYLLSRVRLFHSDVNRCLE